MSCLLKHLTRKIESIVNQHFNAQGAFSSLTEVVNVMFKLTLALMALVLGMMLSRCIEMSMDNTFNL